MPQVLARGPEFGLYAICVDDDARTLPEECTAVAAWSFDAPSSVLLKGHGLEAVGPVLADQVSVAWCDRVARALAPVRDVSREDAESGLPGTVRLLDLLDMPNPTPDPILPPWTGAPTKLAVALPGTRTFPTH